MPYHSAMNECFENSQLSWVWFVFSLRNSDYQRKFCVRAVFVCCCNKITSPSSEVCNFLSIICTAMRCHLVWIRRCFRRWSNHDEDAYKLMSNFGMLFHVVFAETDSCVDSWSRCNAPLGFWERIIVRVPRARNAVFIYL